jgi:glutathione S-transferase
MRGHIRFFVNFEQVFDMTHALCEADSVQIVQALSGGQRRATVTPMLTLHGFSSSNYYNVAKLALLEKALPFRESLVYTGAGEGYHPEYLEQSPLGKVPCLETPEGFISESRCIVDYLERAHPEPPLYPEGAFAQAKLLELTQVIDLYLELPARRLLPNLFRRTPPPEAVATEVRAAVEKGALALARLGRFDAFLLGARFTAADIAGAMHFPVVRLITQTVLGSDPLGAVPGLEAYLARLEDRPTIARVRADRDANFGEFVAHLQKRYSGS